MNEHKYYNDVGEVGVLISPGFGAGWSTWSNDPEGVSLVFDKGLVELALRKAPEEDVEDYIRGESLEENPYVYMGGWKDITVVFLPEGEAFDITEYDGHEGIKTSSNTYTA